jgi:group I intron endonuclease
MIIYRILNTVNGKSYVGQTVRNLTRRIKAHIRSGSDDRRHQSYIAKAISKHGWASFTVEVLEETDEAGLDMAERFWIKTYRSIAPVGYNLDTGGQSKKVSSPQTRARMSAAAKGHVVSETTRAKISATKIVALLLPDVRAKLSLARKGKPNSADQKQKISAALTGRSLTDEHRANIANISNAGVGRAVSADTRLKMSMSAKARRPTVPA